MAVKNFSELDLNKIYTYADYLTWAFQERVELIKGKIFKMSPAPNTRHQLISSNLTFQLVREFQEGSCFVFVAPFDVRLPVPKGEKAYTVVQPDLCVVCNKEKLDEQGCNGAPDLVIEILSPGNTIKEMQLKFEVYEEAGVREYWIVDPEHQSVTPYKLNEDGKFIGLPPKAAGGELASSIFPDLKLELEKVFAF